MSLGEELKSSMPSFMQFCSRVDQVNVQEDWWTAGSDAGKNHHPYNPQYSNNNNPRVYVRCKHVHNVFKMLYASTYGEGNENSLQICSFCLAITQYTTRQALNRRNSGVCVLFWFSHTRK